MEGGGGYGFAAPLSNAHPRLAGTLLFRPLHMAYVQDVASGEAGSLEAMEEGETTQAIRRRLSAVAEALGRTLETRRNGNTVYFWVSEGRRRGRPRKNPGR